MWKTINKQFSKIKYYVQELGHRIFVIGVGVWKLVLFGFEDQFKTHQYFIVKFTEY